MKIGWIYTVTNIVAYAIGTDVTQAAIGYVSGERFWIMKKRSAQNPYETVEYQGELCLKEGDVIRVDFENTTAGNALYVFINGYRRRI
jgi:hypothetical protein